jgi:hypothetical protein
MADGPGEFVGGVAETAVLVGAADGRVSSRIPVTAKHVRVQSNTNDTNDWIVLPTGVLEGHRVTGYSVVAHEIRTEAGSNIKINDVDSDGTAEAAITATWNWEASFMGSTGWVLKAWTRLAAPTTAIIPD